LALLVPSLWSWQTWFGQPPTLVDRVTTMLEERKVDPSSMREFSEFEGDFEGVAAYHIVLGELVRMHGDPDGARLQFQKAAVYDDSDPYPLIFLGNLSMEEGDIQRAIQRYDSAIELEPQSELAFHNLSFAYDQSRRFEEGDEARAVARRLAGDRKGNPGIRGRDDRIRYPVLGKATLDSLANVESAGLLENQRPTLRPDDIVRQLMASTSQIFWVSALLGIVVAAIRSQSRWKAQICTKCGKIFCPRCRSATESAAYCSQCVSVFLQRDMVSKEQQSAKQDQIRRWELRTSIGRSVAGTLIPGSLHILDGWVVTGVFIGFAAWMFLSGSLIWAPLVLPSIDPLMAVLPIQIAFGIGCAALWIPSAAVAWGRR
jgi:hypothetical protein